MSFYYIEPPYIIYSLEERHHAVGRNATFPWSRGLTNPEVKPNASLVHLRSRGLLTTRGHALSPMVAILDSLSLLGSIFQILTYLI